MEPILFYVELIFIHRGYPGFKLLEKNFIPFLGRLPSHQSMLIQKLQLQNKYDEKFL